MRLSNPPISYLVSCSKEGVGAFKLTQLGREAEFRKEVKSVLDDWVEARALAMLAEWVEKYRNLD